MKTGRFCSFFQSIAVRKTNIRCFSIDLRHLESFERIVGKEYVLTDNIGKYTEDWTRQYTGGSVVVLPGSSKEISEILTICNDNGIAVSPQGLPILFGSDLFHYVFLSLSNISRRQYRLGRRASMLWRWCDTLIGEVE